ncbi:MAG: response regulator [Deltaproteobacteria bacterium]|nr:response regulator [Deltaproteobacteria bacterium]
MPPETESSLILPDQPNPLHRIETFRHQVANKVFFAIAAAAPFFLAVGLYRAHTHGLLLLMYWQSGLALLLMGTALFHRRIPYGFRVWIVLICFFFLGIGLFLAYGLLGAGAYFFISGTLIANLCFGVRSGYGAILVSLVCMTVIAVAIHHGWVGHGLHFNPHTRSFSSWGRMIMTAVTFMCILHFTQHRFLSRLTHMIISLDRRSEQLIDTNQKLALEIDDRRKIEKALRDSEMKYRMVIDNANEGIVVLRSGRIHFANKTIMSALGYFFDELRGRRVEDFLHPDDRQRLGSAVGMILDEEVMFGDTEIRLCDGAGAYRWFNAHLVHTLWEDRPAVSAFIYEITDHKTVEAEKARLKDRLKQAEKMEILGTLAGTVAHDLNNVLMGVTSYPDYLLNRIPKESDLHKPLTSIKKSGEKAVAIVQDMLTLARRRVKVSEVCNLSHIVSEFLDSPEFERMRSFRRGVSVETALADQLEDIKGSPIHLSKAVMNLISNALESLDASGRVLIATENRAVADLPNGKQGPNPKAGPHVVLKIKDNGSGIAPEDIEKIYDPFYTKKTMGRSGTGLGMTVVWNAVQDHGGHIHVESAEDRGTTFTLFFPATTLQPEIPESDLPKEPVGKDSASILVVDDSKEYRQMVTQCLADLGYECAAAAGGLAAVHHIEANRVDLAVLDMVMSPGPDGLDTYEQMLRHNPDLKAIIVSGFPETERVRKAQSLGAGPFIQKPFNLEAFGTAVQRELRANCT